MTQTRLDLLEAQLEIQQKQITLLMSAVENIYGAITAHSEAIKATTASILLLNNRGK